MASVRQVRLQLAELAPRTCRSTPDPFSWQEAGSSAFGKMFLRPWFGTMSRPCSWPPVGSRQDLPSPHQIHHPGIPGPSPKLSLLSSSSEKEDSRSRGDSETFLGSGLDLERLFLPLGEHLLSGFNTPLVLGVKTMCTSHQTPLGLPRATYLAGPLHVCLS